MTIFPPRNPRSTRVNRLVNASFCGVADTLLLWHTPHCYGRDPKQELGTYQSNVARARRLW